MIKEQEDHKQAKTTTPLVPLYDWNDDNDEITAVSGVETKEEEIPETTEKSAAEEEDETTTGDTILRHGGLHPVETTTVQSFYPWESPVCKDKSDACESFKHMCSLFRYTKIF